MEERKSVADRNIHRSENITSNISYNLRHRLSDIPADRHAVSVNKTLSVSVCCSWWHNLNSLWEKLDMKPWLLASRPRVTQSPPNGKKVGAKFPAFSGT